MKVCVCALTVSLFAQSCTRLMLLFHYFSLVQVGINSIILYKSRYHSYITPPLVVESSKRMQEWKYRIPIIILNFDASLDLPNLWEAPRGASTRKYKDGSAFTNVPLLRAYLNQPLPEVLWVSCQSSDSFDPVSVHYQLHRGDDLEKRISALSAS